MIRAKWMLTDSEHAEMTCSNCGFTYYGERDYECMSPYCCECGAKMDKDMEDKR